jgi:dTDP-4-dehydrorhamnose 3,5-epimerase
MARVPENARKDTASVSASHALLRRHLHGVSVHDVRNIVTRNGLTTELWRTDWSTAPAPPRQTLYVTLRPGAVSAWHMHERQLDQIFVVHGAVKLVLYDGRDESPTRGEVNELFLDRARPCLVTVPPRIWHGLTALGGAEASFVNFLGELYDHADPDEWRLPPDTPEIPYRF